MDRLVVLSLPGFRPQDLPQMPRLSALMAGGEVRDLTASFPAVTWPVQANMLTGLLPEQHGVVANGFFWRDTGKVEMWTAWNDKIERPQVWDLLHKRQPPLQSAVWFPMLSKGSGADYVCMPAPVHNPDGSESLWCYTKPQEFYGELLERLGHFPLKHFWGPLASIESSRWIARSSVIAAERFHPSLMFIYLPHLDYAAQRTGPDSEAAARAVEELDGVIGEFADQLAAAYPDDRVCWMAASEYVITPVSHVAYPNRVLRDAGLLTVNDCEGAEMLDVEKSAAWALVDHQFSHVFVRGGDAATIQQVQRLFQGQPGIAEVLVGDERSAYAMAHPRSGEVILISEPESWQAYYWWWDDAAAPPYARTVDIHRKPGYDPVELHFDPASRSIPLDATLVRGSHGAPVRQASQRGVVAVSRPGVLPPPVGGLGLKDIDLAAVILDYFGR